VICAERFGVRDRIRALFSPQILVIIPIYCLGLIPATSALAWLCVKLDAWLGIPPIDLGAGAKVALFAACLVVGGAIVMWSYTYLVLEGGGGPVPPFSQNTHRMVTNGPYAWIRHPSIWGKLTGVVGLGLYFGSVTFLVVVIPALLWWSLNVNMRRQDAEMAAAYGEAWRAYCERTPPFMPRLFG